MSPHFLTHDGRRYMVRTNFRTGDRTVFVKVRGRWSSGAVSATDRDAILCRDCSNAIVHTHDRKGA